MRTILLASEDEFSASSFCKGTNEEILRYGKLFLDFISCADMRQLSTIQSLLWPHELRFEDGYVNTQAAPKAIQSVCTDLAIDVQSQRSPHPRVERHWSQFSDHTIQRMSRDRNFKRPCFDSDAFESLRQSVLEGPTDTRSYTQSSDGSHFNQSQQPQSDLRVASPSPELSEFDSSNWPDSPSLPGYLRSLNRLKALYADEATRNELPALIQLGDFCIREDAVGFVQDLIQEWNLNQNMSIPETTQEPNSPVVKKLVSGFRYAEYLAHNAVIDPFALRLSRLLLYHYFKLLCAQIRNYSIGPQKMRKGQVVAAAALDRIVEEIHSADSAQTRAHMSYHKKIGRRWSILADHIGYGILLTCSPELSARINNMKCNERKLSAFLTYVCHVYPQAISINRKLGKHMPGIDRDGMIELGNDLRCELSSYQQVDEQERYSFADTWQRVGFTAK